MRWFKHFSDAHIHPQMSLLIDNYGFEGYGLFWFLLEKVAHQLDQKKVFEVKISVRSLLQVAQKRIKWLTSFFSYLTENDLLFIKLQGKIVVVKAPKLQKYCDEWTQRVLKNDPQKLGSYSGVTREQLGSYSRIEEEVEEDKVNTKESNYVLKTTKLSTPDSTIVISHTHANFEKDFEDYLQAMEEFFPVILPTDAKASRMLFLWRDRGVIAADIKAALRASQESLRKGRGGHPTFVQSQALNFAAFRQKGIPYPIEKSHAEHWAEVEEKFLANTENKPCN